MGIGFSRWDGGGTSNSCEEIGESKGSDTVGVTCDGLLGLWSSWGLAMGRLCFKFGVCKVCVLWGQLDVLELM